jgi:putative ABC transport system ATP-binding protein
MITNTQYIIIVENLYRSYYKGISEIKALNGVSFSIKTGEFISIVGKSGSGKSTLLNLIGGLDKPTKGRIIFNGTGLETMSRRQLSLHRKHSVGMVFQSFNLIPSMNAYENITLALAFGGMPRKRRFPAAVDLLNRVSLNNRIYHKPAELSGGESQRVAIARAMANNPSVLLADEPTGNLDSQTASDILNIIGELNLHQGKTIVMVTHDIDTAMQYSDRIIWLKDGKIEREIQNNQKTGYNPE